jgi:hypothetical protein
MDLKDVLVGGDLGTGLGLAFEHFGYYNSKSFPSNASSAISIQVPSWNSIGTSG